MKIDTLLKAINLADYDGVKTLEVSIDYLMLLREYINALELSKSVLEDSNHRLHISLATSELRALEKPISLSVYC